MRASVTATFAATLAYYLLASELPHAGSGDLYKYWRWQAQARKPLQAWALRETVTNPETVTNLQGQGNRYKRYTRKPLQIRKGTSCTRKPLHTRKENRYKRLNRYKRWGKLAHPKTVTNPEGKPLQTLVQAGAQPKTVTSTEGKPLTVTSAGASSHTRKPLQTRKGNRYKRWKPLQALAPRETVTDPETVTNTFAYSPSTGSETLPTSEATYDRWQAPKTCCKY